MSELETKNEAQPEIEDFSDELSDEALDLEQGEGRFCTRCQSCGGASFVG